MLPNARASYGDVRPVQLVVIAAAEGEGWWARSIEYVQARRSGPPAPDPLDDLRAWEAERKAGKP